MEKFLAFIKSKNIIAIVIKILIVLIAIVVYCTNPRSLVGKGALIRLAITIPINILAHVVFTVLIVLILLYVLFSSISDRNKTARMIAFVICLVFSAFIGFTFLSDQYIPIVSGSEHGSIKGSYDLWLNILNDLNENDIITIEKAKPHSDKEVFFLLV